MFLTEDFYSFGQEAGKAWKEQYQAAYAESYLEHVAAEMQGCVYHLERACFPAEIISSWERGFRDAAMEAPANG